MSMQNHVVLGNCVHGMMQSQIWLLFANFLESYNTCKKHVQLICLQQRRRHKGNEGFMLLCMLSTHLFIFHCLSMGNYLNDLYCIIGSNLTFGWHIVFAISIIAVDIVSIEWLIVTWATWGIWVSKVGFNATLALEVTTKGLNSLVI